MYGISCFLSKKFSFQIPNSLRLAHISALAEILKRPNVFEYLHVPVQSGSDAVLRAMVREYSRAEFQRLVDGLKEKVPEIFIGNLEIVAFFAFFAVKIFFQITQRF